MRVIAKLDHFEKATSAWVSVSEIIKTMGMSAISGCNFNWRQSSNPLKPGIITSSKSKSGAIVEETLFEVLSL